MRETFMNGHDEEAVVFSRANDNAARVIAYFGPYLFWSAVSVIASAILLFG